MNQTDKTMQAFGEILNQTAKHLCISQRARKRSISRIGKPI